MKVTTEMVQRALSVFKGRRMVDPPWQESEAAMRAALEAALTDVPEPDSDNHADLAKLLAAHGTPIGRLKGMLYGALLTDAGRALPIRTQALVLIELATKLAFAAGMSLDEFHGYALCGFQQAVRDLQPLAAPEPGSEDP